VLNPIQRSGYVADGRKAMLLLKNQILDNILLRRTKINRADDIQLPMRVVKVRQEKLDDKEEDFYQALYTQVRMLNNFFLTYLSTTTYFQHSLKLNSILI
jgi:DNA repair protein RAD16